MTRFRRLTRRLKTSSSVNPWAAVVGVLPAIAVIVLFIGFPAVLNLVISFTDYNGIWSETAFVGFRNYIEFFTLIGGDVLPAFGNTLLYAAYVVLPLQVISLGAALLVNCKVKCSGLFRALYFLPSILGSVVVCAAWRLIYDPFRGPLAVKLHIDSAFLGDPDLAMLFISIIALWANFGYSMTLYLAGLQGIPQDCLEAAVIDGANPVQRFFRITLPLLWPSVVICLWIAISGTLGMADYIMLTTQGAHNTTTIGFYIFDTVIKNSVNQGQSAATAIYNFLFVTAIMLAFNFFIRKREVV